MKRSKMSHQMQPPAGNQHYGTPPALATDLAAEPARPKKRKRVFMWTFLAIQAIFLIWLIAGATTQTGPSAHDIAQLCGHGQWRGLFTSHQDCVVHGGNGLTDAGDVGKGIGLALVIGLWIAADVILGIGRLVVVFARRNK
jgi:hypothetical protein